jgi:hypothetical protein
MTCLNPIDSAILADYWLAALGKVDEETIEEHLFACDECGERLREMIALGDGVRKLTREGSLTMVVSDAFLKRAKEQGLRVREYALPHSGSVVECTVTAEDDFLIGRLAADLSAAQRIDLSLCDGQGVEQIRLADIPFQPKATSVTFQQSITYAKAAPSGAMIARLVAFDPAGKERLLGEYTFNHTRTIPGPAGW